VKLTSPSPSQIPDPATIRPLPVLKKTLELLKTKWREENNYGYICDQFKSMRQDLTVTLTSSLDSL
jgi:SAC3 family protein LENG8/THP3